jgi:hypothetical protein
LIYRIFSEPIVSAEETDGKIRADSYEAAYEEVTEDDRKFIIFKNYEKIFCLDSSCTI